MPTGVYHRSKELREKVRKCLDIGRTPKVRAIVREKMIEKAKSITFRVRVSDGTRKAMHRPDVRARHLEGLRKAKGKGGWRGGNGQPITPIVAMAWKVLEPLGFRREFVIKTKGHGTTHKPPLNYKADFAHPDSKTVLELDGPHHRIRRQWEVDQRKTEVLQALGWRVIRLQHGKEVPHLVAVYSATGWGFDLVKQPKPSA